MCPQTCCPDAPLREPRGSSPLAPLPLSQQGGGVAGDAVGVRDGVGFPAAQSAPTPGGFPERLLSRTQEATQTRGPGSRLPSWAPTPQAGGKQRPHVAPRRTRCPPARQGHRHPAFTCLASSELKITDHLSARGQRDPPHREPPSHFRGFQLPLVPPWVGHKHPHPKILSWRHPAPHSPSQGEATFPGPPELGQWRGRTRGTTGPPKNRATLPSAAHLQNGVCRANQHPPPPLRPLS